MKQFKYEVYDYTKAGIYEVEKHLTEILRAQINKQVEMALNGTV